MVSKKVLLFGGIGNQLFQLSRAYQHKLDGKKVTLINITIGKSLIYRFLNLTEHNDWIDMNKISTLIEIQCKKPSFLDIFYIIYVFFQKRFFKNNYFNSDYDINDVYPVDIGYFQSRKHVSINAINMVAQALLDYLSIKNKGPSCDYSIHVRGNEFNAAKREHVQFTTSQDIKNATDFAKKNHFEIKVVTNSKNDAMALFPLTSNINFSNKKNELEDFEFLCLSKNLFLSNSTFSFWALICAKNLYLTDYLLPSTFWFKDFFD